MATASPLRALDWSSPKIVRHPVQLILHRPVAADDPGEDLHDHRQAGQVVAQFHRGFSARFPRRLHHVRAAQAGPFLPVGKRFQPLALPVAAGFQPPVALVHLGHGGQRGGVSGDAVIQIGAHFVLHGALGKL